MFSFLKQEAREVGAGLKPTLIFTDFEVAAFNTAGKIFETAEIRLCRFHFAQSLICHIDGGSSAAVSSRRLSP